MPAHHLGQASEAWSQSRRCQINYTVSVAVFDSLTPLDSTAAFHYLIATSSRLNCFRSSVATHFGALKVQSLSNALSFRFPVFRNMLASSKLALKSFAFSQPTLLKFPKRQRLLLKYHLSRKMNLTYFFSRVLEQQTHCWNSSWCPLIAASVR